MKVARPRSPLLGCTGLQAHDKTGLATGAACARLSRIEKTRRQRDRPFCGTSCFDAREVSNLAGRARAPCLGSELKNDAISRQGSRAPRRCRLVRDTLSLPTARSTTALARNGVIF